MTNLSDLFPAGAGKQVSFVADGAVGAAGKPVVLTAAGKAAPIAETSVTEDIPEGSDTIWFAQPVSAPYNTATYVDIAFDVSSDKFVMVFADAKVSSYASYIVGSISGSTLTYGTKTVFNSSTVLHPSIAADPAATGVFAIAYNDFGGGSGSFIKVGTLTGTTLSFGTGVNFSTANSYGALEFDFTSSTFVLAWSKAADSNKLFGTLGTYSGTTVTLQTEVELYGTGVNDWPIGLAFDPSTTGKFAVVDKNSGSPFAGIAVCCTISGTTITPGTTQTFIATQAQYAKCVFDSVNADNLIIAFRDEDNSLYGAAYAATLSGTVFTFGTKLQFNSTSSTDMWAMAPDGIGKNFQIVYRNADTSSRPFAAALSVSGTTITGGTPVQITTEGVNSGNYLVAAMNPNDAGSFVTAWREKDYDGCRSVASQQGWTVTNLTSTNFLGISDAAILDTASGNVTIKGGIAVTGLSSLTPGSDYYAQGDGTISTTSTSPAVKIGKAMSATSINLEYQS
jgi:hypothetical protein